jgi:cytochrome c nitrite reductase small subunit
MTLGQVRKGMFSRWGMGGISLVLAILVGMFFGIGSFTFGYGRGYSYFSRSPETCVNCHVMQPYYDGWLKSSHTAVASCADCHLPDEFVAGWIAKADNGFRHAWAFTFQNFHEPIQMIPRNQRTLQNACISCHETTVHDMLMGGPSGVETIACTKCHWEVGHGPRGFN